MVQDVNDHRAIAYKIPDGAKCVEIGAFHVTGAVLRCRSPRFAGKTAFPNPNAIVLSMIIPLPCWDISKSPKLAC